MILVAGLAVAGLAGIAAAFYLSMRPSGSRSRTAPEPRRGRAGDSRPAAGRSRTAAPPARSERSAGPARTARSARPAGSARAADRPAREGASTVIDFTGPQRVLEDPEPAPTGRRARHGDRAADTPAEPKPGHRAAARRMQEPDADDDAAQEPRSRRRVGWRKGSDVDEEMWPAASFGGVSDEQFWDDLASDKPLATTARAAQPDTAARRRPPNSGPLPDLYPVGGRAREDGAGGRAGGRAAAAEGPGTHPQPRLGPDDRTAIQPAARPVQAERSSQATGPVATQPYPAARPPYPTATHPSPTAIHPSPTATQPVRAAEPRGRSRDAISPDEDPLTSPAYSLRRKGSVDGRSYPSSRRSGDASREQHDRPAQSTNGRGRPDGYRPDAPRSGGTAPNPYPQQPTQSMNTPANGETYGYGNPAGRPGQGDPRRANGGWSPSPVAPNGADERSWGSRPAYPPVNGHLGYDPRGYDRRLSTTS